MVPVIAKLRTAMKVTVGRSVLLCDGREVSGRVSHAVELDILVLECRFRRDTLGRIIEEHVLWRSGRAVVATHSDEICRARMIAVLRFGEGFAGRAPLRECRLVIGHAADAWPAVLVWCPEQSENAEAGCVRRTSAPHAQLVDLRVAREERRSHDELGEDAADRPHVDWRAVMPRTEQDFGRSIPKRDDL